MTPIRTLRARPIVLVVDDDSDMRQICRTYLSSTGCRVLTARDGVEGVAKAARFRPDVIVLDLAMPRLDGFGAARQLRKSRDTASIPIIAVSAMPHVRVSAREAGCDAFVAKPCVPELLWCEIRVVLHAAGSMVAEMVPPPPKRRRARRVTSIAAARARRS